MGAPGAKGTCARAPSPGPAGEGAACNQGVANACGAGLVCNGAPGSAPGAKGTCAKAPPPGPAGEGAACNEGVANACGAGLVCRAMPIAGAAMPRPGSQGTCTRI